MQIDFSNIPIIPLIALLVILPLVGWQIYSYWDYRKKNQKPNVPDINKRQVVDQHSSVIKNATLLSTLKPKTKVSRKTSLLFSSALGLFVIVNLMVLTFYLRNRKLSYLPRADLQVTPTLFKALITPTITQQIIPLSPTSALIQSEDDSVPQITPTATQTIIPTSRPTIRPTLIPTALAKATPTILARSPYGQAPNVLPTVSHTQSPTPKPTTTISIQPTIPTTGLSLNSLILGGLSLFFLIVGLLL